MVKKIITYTREIKKPLDQVPSKLKMQLVWPRVRLTAFGLSEVGNAAISSSKENLDRGNISLSFSILVAALNLEAETKLNQLKSTAMDRALTIFLIPKPNSALSFTHQRK